MTDQGQFLGILERRFIENMQRHSHVEWSKVQQQLVDSTDALFSLMAMEESGGEPDVVGFDEESASYIFFDCSPESPLGRRGLCYDKAGQNSRKDNSAKGNAIDLASEMGVELLSLEEFFYLQTLGNFDLKTSSWIKTPTAIRELGGALFGDYRYGTVFTYHNGAQSYYSSRGFRTVLKV